MIRVSGNGMLPFADDFFCVSPMKNEIYEFWRSYGAISIVVTAFLIGPPNFISYASNTEGRSLRNNQGLTSNRGNGEVDPCPRCQLLLVKTARFYLVAS